MLLSFANFEGVYNFGGCDQVRSLHRQHLGLTGNDVTFVL